MPIWMLAPASWRPGNDSSLPLGAPAPTNTASNPPLSSNSRIDLDGVIEFQVHAHVDDLRDLVVEHLGRQAERGNVGAHQAAGHAVLLEDGDRVAERHEIVGHRQRGAARADQRDFLAVLELGNLRQAARDVFTIVRGHPFEAADGDWLFFHPAATARRLAGTVADAPENSRKDVRMAVHHVGIGEAPLRNKSNVFGNVGMCWASPLAIHDLVKVVGLRSVRWLHIPPVKPPEFPLRPGRRV